MRLSALFEELARAVPGLLGSAVSMLFIDEPILRRIGMFCGGAAAARFGTAWFARTSGLDEGFTGFLLGLFGMVVVARIFSAWEKLELGTLARDWLRKLLGLPPAKEGT